MSTLPEDPVEPDSSIAPEASRDEIDANRPVEQHTDQVSEQQPERDPPAAASKKAGPTLCGVCNSNASKYKCPRCYLPYCSVACNKTHRENHPPDPETKPKPQPVEAPKDTTTTTSDPKDPFRALETSDKLKFLFQKYPNLPGQLLQIHAATLPPSETSQNPGIPASLLKGLPKKDAWNHDIGIQNGKEALRKARRADGEEGEAIREYSELILHIMNTEAAESNVTALLQQQLVEEDNKLIGRLMAEERR